MMNDIKDIIDLIKNHLELEDGDDRYCLECVEEKLTKWLNTYDDDGK